MGHIFFAFVILILGGNMLGFAQAQQTDKSEAVNPVTSIYTGLSSDTCQLAKSEKESTDSIQSCRGIAGYRLLVEDSDARMSITVITPNRKRYPLNYWHVITQHFSSLGSKAEWRIAKKNGKVIPLALIVRVNANEGTDPQKITSYLAVAKITPETICVTDKISPGPMVNVEARHAADVSARKPCLME